MNEQKSTVTTKEKNKRIVRNILSYLLNNFASIAFGLIVPHLFLVNFGSEVNGLVHTVKQILSYLSLLEAGVGSSAQQALYRHVAKEDREPINAIMSATHHYYQRTGIVYFILSVAFAIVYPLLVHTELQYTTVFIIIMLYALPEVLKFLIQGKFRIFLDVEGKTYVLNNISTTMLFVCNLLRILALCFTDNLLLIQATYCLPSLAQLVIILIYIRRNYPWLNVNVKPDLSALKQKNSVLVHKISGIIFNNVDTVLISVVCGLREASVYTVYNLFFMNIEKLINSFTDSIKFRLGQIFQTNREKFSKLYDIYEEVYITLSFLIYTGMTAFLLPIISLYTKGVDDAVYINPLYVILFSASNTLLNIKYPATQIIDYSGDFDKTRHHAVIEMLINLIVSIPAAYMWGIVGCLAGTIAALIYRSVAILHYTNRNILGISSLRVIRRILVNTAVSVSVILLIGTQSCEPTGYLHVILTALLNAIWIAALFASVNLVFEWKTLKNIFSLFKKKV